MQPLRHPATSCAQTRLLITLKWVHNLCGRHSSEPGEAWERVGPGCRQGGQLSPAPGAGLGAARGAGAGSGGRGGDCRPPPHPGGGAGPRGVGSSCSRPRHPLGLGSGARVSGARRASATRHRVEQPRPRRTQSCQSKRRHAGQRHGAHGGSDLLGSRPAPSLQEPGEEGARRAARGCESAWGGRGPGRLRGTAPRNPSPASPR